MTDLDEDFKEKGGRPKKKSFTDVARAAGIKDATLDILLNEDFDSIEAVKCLSEDIVRSMGPTRVSSCSGCSLCSRKRGCRRRLHTHYLLPQGQMKDKEESEMASMLGVVGGAAIPPAPFLQHRATRLLAT